MSLIDFKNVKLLVFDFDGVMTDNRVLVMQDGSEGVFCNRADGIGIEMLRNNGYKMLILSTETNPVVNARAKKLALPVIQGSSEKLASLCKYCEEENIPLKKIAFVGNDINDLEVMGEVGFKICPKDAHEKIKTIADWIIPKNGGEGIIREIADRVCD